MGLEVGNGSKIWHLYLDIRSTTKGIAQENLSLMGEFCLSKDFKTKDRSQ